MESGERAAEDERRRQGGCRSREEAGESDIYTDRVLMKVKVKELENFSGRDRSPLT